jgi:Protein of unknown function (DUF3168)
MSEATLPLQKAIVALIDADAPLRALVPLGLLDPVPQGTTGLYMRPTGWLETEDGDDCGDAVRVAFEIQCYAPPPARDDLATLAGMVKRILHRAAPAVAGFSEVQIRHRDTQYFDEPDGLSRRAVCRFEALADEA